MEEDERINKKREVLADHKLMEFCLFVCLFGWLVLLAFFRDSFPFHTTQVKIENVTREENLTKFCEVRSLCQCQVDYN